MATKAEENIDNILLKIKESLNTFGYIEQSLMVNFINNLEDIDLDKLFNQNEILKEILNINDKENILGLLHLITKYETKGKLNHGSKNQSKIINSLIYFIKTENRLPSQRIVEEKPLYAIYGKRNKNMEAQNKKIIDDIWLQHSNIESNEDKIIMIKDFIKTHGVLPNKSITGGEKLFNIYTNRNKYMTKEEIKILEDIWLKHSSTKTEDERAQLIKDFVKENDRLPDKSITGETYLYNLYISRNKYMKTTNIKELENIWLQYSSIKTEEERVQLIKDFIKVNGRIPIVSISEESYLYNIYSSRNKMEDKNKKILEDIWSQYSSTKTDIQKIQLIKDFVEENDRLPGYNIDKEVFLYNIYVNRNKYMNDESIQILDDIWSNYSNFLGNFSRNIMTEINKISIKVEDLVETISKNQTTQDMIPTFSIIESIYKDFSESEKARFAEFNQDLKLLCDHILEKEYSLITTNVLSSISASLIEDIKQNPNRNGKYLAWKLNKDLYSDEETRLYSEEEEQSDLYRLRDVSDFLSFENSITNKKEIIGGFDIFLDKITIMKDGKRTSLLNGDKSVIAEVKNHIITFFENFNEDDFFKMKEAMAGKSEEEFMEVILERINNSSLIIPSEFNGEYKKPSSVFTKKDGKWFYSMMGGGRFDLYASYDKKIVTASTTTSDENGFEGSQLLVHPVKSRLLSDYAVDIIRSETQLLPRNNVEGYNIFNEESIFYGLKWQKVEGEIIFEINDEEILKENQLVKNIIYKNGRNLLANQFKHMDIHVLLHKIILEGDKFRKKAANAEKNERLLSYRKRIVRIGVQQNKQTLIDYMDKNSVVKNKLTEENMLDILGNHVFDFQSLTLSNLSTLENELLLEVWLKKEFSLYAGFTTDETNIEEVFFNNLKLRNPLIKVDTEVMYDNNKSGLFVEFLIEALQNVDIDNIYNDKKEDYKDPSDVLYAEFQSLLEVEDNKYEDIGFISKYFLQRISKIKNQERFLFAIVEYIHELSKTDKNQALSLISNERFISNLDNLFYKATQGAKNLKNRMHNTNLVAAEPEVNKEELDKAKMSINKKLTELFKSGKLEFDDFNGMNSELIVISNVKELKEFKTKYVKFIAPDGSGQGQKI